jgi:acetoacetate decarboxylase
MPGFEFENDATYTMPFHFGPMTEGWDPLEKVAHYEDVLVFAVRFLTDGAAVSSYLPPGFSVTEPAVLTVRYLQYVGSDFLAGGGYNVVGVDVSARFEGDEDRLEGDYALVLWENHGHAVITGREFGGAPKLMVDVPPHWSIDGRSGWHASENGTRLMEGEVWDLQPVPAELAKPMADQLRDRPWMGWKYVPSISGRSADVSYPTLMRARLDELKEVRAGRGSVRFFETAFKQAPQSFRAASALAKLPLVQEAGAFMLRGSISLLFGESRPLR